MSELLIFPRKYHIIWLDKYIGEPDVCLQLKRAFFTHIDPESGKEVCLSDDNINHFIQSQSDIPITFDSFNCILRAFDNEESCLEYVDKIQNDRILFISSSTLGESAVKKLMDKYIHSFTNEKNKSPYASIYVFCTDIEAAAEWSFPYIKYVNVFDFETDLLARMTRDVAEEFLDHGKQLIQANQNEAALERFSWSRSLYIRHENLKFPSNPKTHSSNNDYRKQSQKIQEIDQFIETIEKKLKQQYENDSDQDDSQIQINSEKIPSPNADHLIIYLDESINLSEQIEVENQYKTTLSTDSTSVQIDKSINQRFNQFQNQWKSYLSNIPSNIEIYHNIDDCHQSIIENNNRKTIFLIISDSIADKILKQLIEKHYSIKNIYIINGFITKYINWINQYYQENINIILFNCFNELLINILKDITQYYLLKGKQFISSFDNNSTFIYFDWAKQITFFTQQLTNDYFQDQINNIEKSKNQTEILFKQKIQNFKLEQKEEDEDDDSVVIIFIVGLEIELIDFISDIAQILTCKNNDEVILIINNIKLLRPIIIISSILPNDYLMSFNQLLYYYSSFKSNQSNITNSTINYSNFSYFLSTEHLLNQLNHKLAEYYRDSAIKQSIQNNNQNKAKRLIQKSTKCYQLLENNTNNILKRYADILKKQEN